MLKCQKHLFSLPKEVTYLNGAYMSPLAKSVEYAGYQGIVGKKQPFEIAPIDFFDPIDEVRKLYAKLVNAPHFKQIAMLPSVSYGIATVAKKFTCSFILIFTLKSVIVSTILLLLKKK